MHDSSNKGRWSESDHRSTSKIKIMIKDERSKIAVSCELPLGVLGVRNQSAGGGRINGVVTRRKIGETSEARIAKAAVPKTGADATEAVLSPA